MLEFSEYLIDLYLLSKCSISEDVVYNELQFYNFTDFKCAIISNPNAQHTSIGQFGKNVVFRF